MKKNNVRSRRSIPDGFVPARILCEALSVSRYTVQRLREQGVFQNGVHWIDINPFATPRYRYHLGNCKARLIELRTQADQRCTQTEGG